MLNGSQMKVDELQSEVDRLTPLAKAERLADAAGIENYWKGSTAQLKGAQQALQCAIDEREAQAFASEVRQIEDLHVRRDEVTVQLKKLDDKVATFSEVERTYFKRANDLMRWTDHVTSSLPQYPTSATQRNWKGEILDIPPKDHLHQPVVPDEAWEAVKELREIYKERAVIGQSLSNMDGALRDLIARNPALALIRSPQLQPA
jgi:hypothetical protein